MQINGKERKFLLSVGATVAIAKLCPGKDFANIAQVIAKGIGPDTIDNLIKIAHELNKAYEVALKFEDGDHVVDIVSEEELMAMPFNKFIELQNEISKSIAEGFGTEVELEESRKKAETVQP